MIPRANITAWRSQAPWPSNGQVEQDLVLSRALVAMFQQEIVSSQAVLRGGTALHKLFFETAGRYSEDIDLVQRQAGPIGELINSIRVALDPWLDDPRWKQGAGRFTLIYRFKTTFDPVSTMRLKIEVNTREHFSVSGVRQHSFTVNNPWFHGSADLSVFDLNELLGTKMRALYQRKKGRDLYDLWLALRTAETDADRIVQCFQTYMNYTGASVSRAEFEANLSGKLKDKVFAEDIHPLIPAEVDYDPMAAAGLVREELIARLPGNPWRGGFHEVRNESQVEAEPPDREITRQELTETHTDRGMCHRCRHGSSSSASGFVRAPDPRSNRTISAGVQRPSLMCASSASSWVSAGEAPWS